MMLDVVDAQLASKWFIRGQVLDKLREVWEEEWVQYPKGRQSKQLFLHQDKACAKK